MNQQISDLLDQIEEMKAAMRCELMDEYPNEKTILAIKHRVRSLDESVNRRILAGAR